MVFDKAVMFKKNTSPLKKKTSYFHVKFFTLVFDLKRLIRFYFVNLFFILFLLLLLFYLTTVYLIYNSILVKLYVSLYL